MDEFLSTSARQFGFTYGLQATAEVAARLEAEGDSYTAAVLTPAEYALYAPLTVWRRRVEWLAGRLAARCALAGYWTASGRPSGRAHQDASSVSILSHPNQAPLIQEHPELHLSISHSHAYAVAVVALFEIGVDIEKVEPRPPALASYFFTPEERGWLGQGDPSPKQAAARITRLWSRKEALTKYLQLGRALAFNQINVLPDQVCLAERKLAPIHLVSGFQSDSDPESDGYCISIAIPVSGELHDETSST